jgi:arylsulfatase A-like enzyme
VRQGARLADANLVDVAPTILHHLGLGVPSDFDGRVLAEAFTADELARHPVRSAPPADPSPPGGTVGQSLSTEAEREIRERLKGIGYVG